MEPLIAIEPVEERIDRFVDAVEGAGGTVVAPERANGLVWLLGKQPAGLLDILDKNPQIQWVQLPLAGADAIASSGILERPITLTSVKSILGVEVGELAFGLILACLRSFVAQARAQHWMRKEPQGLTGKRVTLIGAGGIAATLVPFLRAANCTVTVLRRTAQPFEGAHDTTTIDQLDEVLPNTDILVVAAPLTSETVGMIGARQLSLLPRSAVLVNVGRGKHVDTDALVDALRSGAIAAAGLDVTEPEPLPDGHPLWSFDNVMITSHCANSTATEIDQLVVRLRENTARFAADEALDGVIDPEKSY